MKERGVVYPGNFADLVIFDYSTIGMKATYKNPRQAPEGIQHVIINGQIVMTESQQQETTVGKLLRKNQ